jgi:hypothetical protein
MAHFFKNKFNVRCNSCKAQVSMGEGFTQRTEEAGKAKYTNFCANCVPARKGVDVQQKSSVRVLTSDLKIITGYEPENLDLLRSLPGARWDKANKWWTVSADVSDRPRILEVADRIGLEVAPSLRIVQVNAQAQKAADLGLYPYQVDGVSFLSSKKRALLGDEMGLGKTVQSLMGVDHGGMAMVICRAGLKYNWVDEVRKWRPDLTPTVLKGRESFRWPQQGEIVIINNDILPDEFVTPAKAKGQPLDQYFATLNAFRQALREKYPQASQVNLIVDEAHDYKNKKAARTRKTKEIGNLVAKVTALTGSPLTNHPEDLWGVLDTVGVAKEVFRSFENFQGLFNAHHNGYAFEYGKPKPIVPELLRRVMLRRLRADVLPDLPTKTYTNVMVDPSQKLVKKLDEAWSVYDTELEDSLPPFSQFAALRAELAESRVPAMLEYVQDCEEQECPLIVFSAHLAPMNALLARPGWALITGDTSPERRQEIVRSFQAGQLKGIGITIRAGGVGLTLTHAAKSLFVDLDWTPAANWQAEDRICRLGQTANKVEIVRMVSNHPLDLHIQKLLVDKIDTIQRSIDNSIKGQRLTATPVGAAQPEVESEEEFQARLQRVVEEQGKLESAKLKAKAKSKVDGIHKREVARAKKGVRLELTPDRSAEVRAAFGYMLGVCDGANQRDGHGFNKPDAAVAHWLLTAGLETAQELEAGFLILSRYRRQLSERFPLLFGNSNKVA